MPPEPLISSTAICRPLCVDWPNVASAPVIDPYSPTTIWVEAALPPPEEPRFESPFGQPPSVRAAAIAAAVRAVAADAGRALVTADVVPCHRIRTSAARLTTR